MKFLLYTICMESWLTARDFLGTLKNESPLWPGCGSLEFRLQSIGGFYNLYLLSARDWSTGPLCALYSRSPETWHFRFQSYLRFILISIYQQLFFLVKGHQRFRCFKIQLFVVGITFMAAVRYLTKFYVIRSFGTNVFS